MKNLKKLDQKLYKKFKIIFNSIFTQFFLNSVMKNGRYKIKVQELILVLQIVNQFNFIVKIRYW